MSSTPNVFTGWGLEDHSMSEWSSRPLFVIDFCGSAALALDELLDFREQALCLPAALDIQVE